MFYSVRLAFLVAALGACAAASYGGEPLGRPIAFSDEHPAGEPYMQVRLLGALDLPRVTVNGFSMVELSGIAWDEDEGLLYAVSDNGGLFHLRPLFSEGMLVGVEAVDAVAIRDRRGRRLRGHALDAEGLDIASARNGQRGDTRLFIAFEVRPRLLEVRPDGSHIKTHSLPANLGDVGRYVSTNKALESTTLHPNFGLLTAPERPLRGADPKFIGIFGLGGETWSYPRGATPGSSLVAMEALPDGSLLTLERSFRSMLLPLVITLRRTAPLDGVQSPHPISVTDLAVFSSSDGWRVDNFEGLARHRGRRFFMISDDNRQAFQRTILVYFEILDQPVLEPPESALEDES